MIKCSRTQKKTHTHIIVILNWILNWKCIKAENFYEIVINWEKYTKNMMKKKIKMEKSFYCHYFFYRFFLLRRIYLNSFIHKIQFVISAENRI